LRELGGEFQAFTAFDRFSERAHLAPCSSGLRGGGGRVVHIIVEDETIRIISARKAAYEERNHYDF
jgi:hypothetical protein